MMSGTKNRIAVLLLLPLLSLLFASCNNSIVNPVAEELPNRNDTVTSPGIENVYPVPSEPQLA